jgi:hypothetical protein
MNAPKLPTPRLPLFALIFMSMFGFIGVAVLIFVWSGRGDFPPLIFRLVASFIAIAFMAMGFGAPISAILHRTRNTESQAAIATAEPGEPPRKGYKCPNCGAGLGTQEVSPSGDVKCTYCHKWWNIYRTI